MARQATVNHGPTTPLNGMLDGLGDLGTNVVTLATLQARLAVEDARESAKHALPAIIATVILLPLGFASLTVALIGAANWLTDSRGFSRAQSDWIVAAVGLAISAFLALLAIARLRASLVSFRRSREEFERNIAWLGTILMHSGR